MSKFIANPIIEGLEKWSQYLQRDTVLVYAPTASNDASLSTGAASPNAALIRQKTSAGLILSRIVESHTSGVDTGLILADDVGLGKTWVGILVAFAVAASGGKVLVCAPNRKLQSKWAAEFSKWWNENYQHPDLQRLQQKELLTGDLTITVTTDGERLGAHRILIITHHDYRNRELRVSPWTPDLLILDEAHRGRGGESSGLYKRLEQAHRDGFRLLLTATPFGFSPGKLHNMLKMLPCEAQDLKMIAELIDEFDDLKNALDTVDADYKKFEEVTLQLSKRLGKYVIRHHVDSLDEQEKTLFGRSIHVIGKLSVPWDSQHISKIQIPSREASLENDNPIIDLGGLNCTDQLSRLILHTERLTSISSTTPLGKLTSPVSVDYITSRAKDIRAQHAGNQRIAYHCNEIERLADLHETQVKQRELRAFARACFERGEKFIVFCYHLKTADEVHRILNEEWLALAEEKRGKALVTSETKEVFSKYLELAKKNDKDACEQILARLSHLLAACRSWEQWELDMLVSDLLNDSAAIPSKKEIEQGSTDPDTTPDDVRPEVSGFIRKIPSLRTNDIWTRYLFNSPFLPMALVLTNEHSEGIDLHKYCRLLVHYELSYSPVSIIQRNGRVRRVNSFASKIGNPVIYYYPYVEDTRDAKLAQIVIERTEIFRRLMGGFPELKDNSVRIEGPTQIGFPDYSNASFRRRLEAEHD